MRVLLKLVFFLVLAAAGALFFSLRSYRAFSQEELVAVVRCEKPERGGEAGEFLLEITPIEGGTPGRPARYEMTGEQWSIGGDILKWEPWLAFLGLKSRQKLTRLNSRYWTAEAELSQPRKVYDLGGGTPDLWRWLYRNGAPLPFVDAVYGNAAYVPARPGGRWGVYATHSGYFIRPLRVDRSVVSSNKI